MTLGLLSDNNTIEILNSAKRRIKTGMRFGICGAIRDSIPLEYRDSELTISIMDFIYNEVLTPKERDEVQISKKENYTYWYWFPITNEGKLKRIEVLKRTIEKLQIHVLEIRDSIDTSNKSH